MKIASLASIVASLCVATVCVASETHDIDKGLESSLRATLRDKHVHVHVHEGVVTLDGKVPTEADRARIEALVRQTAGVVAVKDELHVTLPSPGAYGGVATSVPVTSVPVYVSAPPVITPPTTVVTSPAPLILPEYPRISVQAWSPDDQPVATRVARQLQLDALPVTVIDNVTITVQGGDVSLKGAVDTKADHDALIAAIQHAGGIRAIYDQVRVRSL